MRVLLAILLGGLALVGTAEARLGETIQETDQRYGKPDNIYKGTSEDWYDESRSYRNRNGFRPILCMFVQGKCERIEYCSKETELKYEEVEELIKRNLEGKRFEYEGSDDELPNVRIISYRDGQKKISAWWYRKNSQIPNSLYISTEVYDKKFELLIKRKREEEADKRKQELKGL